MDEKVNYKFEFRCNICNKYYSSKSSLCNHNKKFHNIKVTDSNGKVTDSNGKVTDSNGKVTDSNGKVTINLQNQRCKYCNKLFKSKQNKYEHQKKVCEPKHNKIIINDQKQIDLKLKKAEAKILELKLKLEQSQNIDNITLKKINKKLIERNNLIKNSTINIQNNNITNNYQLIGFGKEEVKDTISNKEIKLIMNSKYGCLEKLVEIVHCGKYNQFKNIIITNMNNNYMYKYDENKGYFVLSTKNEVLNSLVDYRIGDIEIIYNDLLDKNKIDEKTKDIIEKFINKITYDDSKFIDSNGKQHENYKQYKINEIKVLLFNNHGKINNDISLFLTTNEIDYEPPLELLISNEIE